MIISPWQIFNSLIVPQRRFKPIPMMAYNAPKDNPKTNTCHTIPKSIGYPIYLACAVVSKKTSFRCRQALLGPNLMGERRNTLPIGLFIPGKLKVVTVLKEIRANAALALDRMSHLTP